MRPDTDPTLTPEQCDVDSEPAGDDDLSEDAIAGYQLRRKIGLGGMGEVVLARDPRLERDVAVKRLRHANPAEATVARFLREARIQARLDHPAIVPVHELGRDSHGQPYFTMKRLTGTTLAVPACSSRRGR